jgi:uncharacterized protein (TIGR03086 family)
MTAISERYAKLAGQMADRIAAVPADGWDASTPCEDWTARQLLDHLIDGPGSFFGVMGLDSPPPGPDAGEDPLGAFSHIAQVVQAGLDDPAVAGLEFDGPIGRQTYEDAVNQFFCGDLLVHQWDLARATGQDETLDADEVSGMFAAMLPMDDMLRTPGIFGPKVEPPAGADAQTQFLCFLGRPKAAANDVGPSGAWVMPPSASASNTRFASSSPLTETFTCIPCTGANVSAVGSSEPINRSPAAVVKAACMIMSAGASGICSSAGMSAAVTSESSPPKMVW